MRPEETIKIAIHCFGVQAEQKVCEECPVYLESGIACREVARVAISALKEVQQYREIGTVEECREAKEKQIPIPVKNRTIMREFYGHPYSIRGDCPKCGSKALMSTLTDYCNACGQHLKWSDTEEKCESGKEDE